MRARMVSNVGDNQASAADRRLPVNFQQGCVQKMGAETTHKIALNCAAQDANLGMGIGVAA